MTSDKRPAASFAGSLLGIQGAPGAIVLGLSLAFLGAYAWHLWNVSFLGWDTYPILAASQVGSFTELFDKLFRPLGDGLVGPQYFRPLLTLMIAVEWPLWGLNAAPYLWLNVIIFGLCALELFRLARRLETSATGPMVAAITALFFLAHPVSQSVVPFVARRPDLLSVLFVLMALRLDHKARFTGSRKIAVLALMAVAAAILSKEAAIVLPLLIAASRWLFPATGNPLREAVRGFLISGTVLLVAAAPRFLVLDGLGGRYGQAPPHHVLRGVFAGVFLPEQNGVRIWTGLLLLIAGLVLLFQLGRRSDAFRLKDLRLLLLGAFWLLSYAVLFAYAGRVSAWYVMIIVAGAALGVGTVVAAAFQALQQKTASRSMAILVLLGAFFLHGHFLWVSPLCQPMKGLAVASRWADGYLDTLEQKLQDNADRIETDLWPQTFNNIAVMRPNTVRGWLKLKFPERDIVVLPGDTIDSDGKTVVVLGAENAKTGIRRQRLPRHNP